MNVQNWVTNAGSQALQKLVAFNMDKLTAGLAAPSHLPQQPLVQKLEVSAPQVMHWFVRCCWKLCARHPYAAVLMTAVLLMQAGCLLAYTLCLTLWFYTELLTHRRR